MFVCVYVCVFFACTCVFLFVVVSLHLGILRMWCHVYRGMELGRAVVPCNLTKPDSIASPICPSVSSMNSGVRGGEEAQDGGVLNQ